MPDTRRACLISNTDSRANLKYGLAGVEQAAAAARLRHQSVTDISTLADVLGDCARREDQLIIVNAGDGTVGRVLEHIRNDGLFRVEPVLALLRGGTTNMVHNDVGVPGRPEAALRRLVASLPRGRFAYRDRHVLRVTGTSHPAARYGFFLGTNAVLRAILYTRERLHHRVSTGRLSELLSVSAMIWRLLRRRVESDPVLSPVPVSLSRDGEPGRRRSQILLMAITVHTAILGIRPLRHGQRAGLAVLDWPDYRLISWIRRFIAGGLESFDRIDLRGDFGWILDGEVHEHRDAHGALTVQVDAPVRFLLPASGP